MKITLAVLDKHGKNASKRVLTVFGEIDSEKQCHFRLAWPEKIDTEKDLEVLTREKVDSSVVFGYASSRPKATEKNEFVQLDDAVLVFEGRMYSPISRATMMMAQLGKDARQCDGRLRNFIKEADGDYLFLLLKEDWIAVGRDPIGVQPLYYGENQEIAAVATNKKTLLLLGIANPRSFPPGNLAFANREGFQFKPVKTLSFTEPTVITLDKAAEKLRSLLTESIRRRTRDCREIAVAFSGGLDSSVVAYLASKLGVKVNLIHVSMENQPETEEAVNISRELDLPMQAYFFKDSDVEAALPKVVGLIEEADPIKASIGLPFYWTAEKAAEAGLRVVLAGQGADELFGGYQRYVTQYCKEGSAAVLKTMFNDVVNIHLSNLERDLKITGYHDVELRLPFAMFDIAEFALSLPIECKIEPKPDTLRKLVLRKIASDAGMPTSVVDKPKKAVQYSTGINDAVKRVAKKHGKTVNDFVAELLQTIGFEARKTHFS